MHGFINFVQFSENIYLTERQLIVTCKRFTGTTLLG